MYLIPIVFVVIFLISIIKRNSLIKQAQFFNRLLYIDKSPEKYIEELDRLLAKFQSQREKNINYIQKTTGLMYAGRFEEAIDILNNKVSKIPPNWQVIYYHNMLLSLYFKGDVEKANKILAEVKTTIDSYYNKDYNKVTIELIYAVSDFYKGEISKCKDFFNTLIDVAKNDYRIALGYYFSGKILEIEGKMEESKEYFEKVRTYGGGSFMESY